MANWYWLLARGLSSLPCEPLHNTAWVSHSMAMASPGASDIRENKTKSQYLLSPSLRKHTPQLLQYSIGYTNQPSSLCKGTEWLYKGTEDLVTKDCWRPSWGLPTITSLRTCEHTENALIVSFEDLSFDETLSSQRMKAIFLKRKKWGQEPRSSESGCRSSQNGGR